MDSLALTLFFYFFVQPVAFGIFLFFLLFRILPKRNHPAEQGRSIARLNAILWWVSLGPCLLWITLILNNIGNPFSLLVEPPFLLWFAVSLFCPLCLLVKLFYHTQSIPAAWHTAGLYYYGAVFAYALYVCFLIFSL